VARWWDGTAWTAHVGGSSWQAAGPGVAAPRPDYSNQPWSHDPASDRSMGLVANLLAMLGGLIGTGIFYAVTKERSQFVRHHAAEALNFTITLTIVSFALPLGVMALLMGGTFVFGRGVAFGGFFVLFPLTMGIGLVALVLPIMAMVAANRGEWYRYPLIFRFVKGPLDLETTERG
jgi:uncharacterized Tic20 family protein